MLLDHEEDYTVVRSDQSGLFQHSPFSWQILGPDFVEVERVTDASRFVSVQEEISFFYGRVIRELFVLLRVK